MISYLKHVAAVAATTLLAVGASAEPYPSKPVRIVVGYAPGGGPDILARALAEKLTQSMGQSFIVDTRSGASGTLATGQVIKSPADGYTLLLGETAQLVIAPYIYKSLPYDTLKDLRPVALIATVPLLLVTSAKTSDIVTFADLVREARAHPNKLDYGSVGVGSIHHIAMESMKKDLGINITHVPYKGGSLAVNALLAGEVPMILTTVSSLGANASQGHILAVTSKARYSGMPNVPAISEVVGDFDFSSEMGILAPAGTPPEIVARLAAAIGIAVNSADFRERLKSMGFSLTWEPPDSYAENIRRNLLKYARAVKVANIQPE